MFFHLFIIVSVNAHILYKKASSSQMRLESFISIVGEGLAGKFGQEIPPTLCGQTSFTSDRLTGRHFPQKMSATDKNTRPWKVCGDKQKKESGKWARKETTLSFYCPSCDVFCTKADYTEIEFFVSVLIYNVLDMCLVLFFETVTGKLDIIVIYKFNWSCLNSF